MSDRRTTLATLTGLAAAGVASPARAKSTRTVYPKRLMAGDTVAMVAPAGVIYNDLTIQLAQESLAAMGLKVKTGAHVLDRHGYLAGTDEARAADLNAAFANEEISGIFCLRGGWGCARMLEYLDFKRIAANPKALIGYSDITTLLNAIYAKTGLVTFHAPNGDSAWHNASWSAFKALVFDGEKVSLADTPVARGTLAKRSRRAQTVVPGTATGRLIGGNLTLITNLLGTPYLPDMTGHILCIEEVNEWVYRCDRMLTQLSNSGILDQVAGVALGTFSGCTVQPDGGYGTFSLMDVFKHHFGRRNIPCFYGLQFGHVREKLSLPFGVNARIDADAGSLQLLEPAVL